MTHAETQNRSRLTITLNGQSSFWPPGSSLADVIDACGIAENSVATAVNGEFVALAQRAACRLNDGDRISCFQAIVGG